MISLRPKITYLNIYNLDFKPFNIEIAFIKISRQIIQMFTEASA